MGERGRERKEYEEKKGSHAGGVHSSWQLALAISCIAKDIVALRGLAGFFPLANLPSPSASELIGRASRLSSPQA